MNILMANWTWYPSGGDWTYIENISKIFESKGHHVIPFSMHDERNFPTPYSKYFVKKIDYKKLNDRKNLSNSWKVVSRAIYSFEAKRKITELLSENQVDLVQLNNINNYLTPSIIPVIKKYKVPIIWRILDYKLICPNTIFVSNGDICESCKVHKYYMCSLKKCKKDSFRASIIASLESYVHMFLNYNKYIDLFLFQSEFSRDKFLDYGFDKSKTAVIENPIDYSRVVPNYTNNGYILYFGRLEKSKGIFTLLKAMKLLPKVKLKIIGDGTEFKKCEELINQQSLNNVELLGAKWGNELEGYLKNCKFVVVPSEWYEVSPYAILQAFAWGKPVIGTNIAGIKDIIDHKNNGILFNLKDFNNLADEIFKLFIDDESVIQMGNNARATIEKFHSFDIYYQKMRSVFSNISTEILK